MKCQSPANPHRAANLSGFQQPPKFSTTPCRFLSGCEDGCVFAFEGVSESGSGSGLGCGWVWVGFAVVVVFGILMYTYVCICIPNPRRRGRRPRRPAQNAPIILPFSGASAPHPPAHAGPDNRSMIGAHAILKTGCNLLINDEPRRPFGQRGLPFFIFTCTVPGAPALPRGRR